MKVTARLPIHVRGTPVRNNGPRDILVSMDSEWEIPEVSASETELAFESFDYVRSIVDEDDPLKRTLAHERLDRYVKAITYDGHLYRRLSHDGEDISTMFSRAFPGGWENDSGVGVGGDISYPGFSFPTAEERRERPISLPVFRQLRWHLLSASVKDSTLQNQETWPQSIPAAEAERGMYQRRNFVTFEEVLPKIVQYDHDQLEECMRTHAGHMSNFLIVDGELWMKTRPPVYRVERRYDSRERGSATISLVFAPDWHDTRLARTYFSLGARDEAFGYANALCDTLSGRKLVSWQFQDGQQVKSQLPAIRGEVADFTSRHVIHAPSITDYPCHEEELRRMSFGLAVEANRFVTRNPSWREKFGEDAVNGVLRSFAEVMGTNYVLGEYGDASDHLETNATVWKKARRVHSTYDFGEVEVADMLIERARSYEENKPIDVRAVHQPVPGRTF
ncbi:hypothetical protein OIU34_17070 [Pararhizobium sp. BT-229]|uniref:hypothetical protein n=1 Tax=Pararhizobium sp. BT-229 TaxID=2986923 RepID=UPI0021F6A2E6|nr:hypothetical protein [Pararhizobium sp. BT-229]MCV9963613.1 hypothetical protein [Pararhizobium sp. BT-229]